MVDSMNRTTILFVDDDHFIRGAYGELLRDEGFSVVEAADGCEALKAATAISGDVLLVLDEEMPCMRGSEVLDLLDGRADAALIPCRGCCAVFVNERLAISNL